MDADPVGEVEGAEATDQPTEPDTNTQSESTEQDSEDEADYSEMFGWSDEAVEQVVDTLITISGAMLGAVFGTILPATLETITTKQAVIFVALLVVLGGLGYVKSYMRRK